MTADLDPHRRPVLSNAAEHTMARDPVYRRRVDQRSGVGLPPREGDAGNKCQWQQEEGSDGYV